MILPVHSLLGFLIVVLIVTFMPGPAMLYCAQQGTKHGHKTALLASIGVEFGVFILVLAAVFGLSIILASSKMLFLVIQVIGALYLIYLGIKSIVGFYVAHHKSAKIVKGHSIFIKGMLINLTNPKVIVFLAALLPQFVYPHKPHAFLALLILGVFYNFMGVVVNVTVGQIAAFTHRNAIAGSPSFFQRIFSSWGIGIVFIILGIVMLLTH